MLLIRIYEDAVVIANMTTGRVFLNHCPKYHSHSTKVTADDKAWENKCFCLFRPIICIQ